MYADVFIWPSFDKTKVDGNISNSHFLFLFPKETLHFEMVAAAAAAAAVCLAILGYSGHMSAKQHNL